MKRKRYAEEQIIQALEGGRRQQSDLCIFYNKKHGGETGIRTLETPFEAYALSRRARSTTPASLLAQILV